MIKIKRKKIIKEAEPIGGTLSTLNPTNTSDEATIDSALKARQLNRLASLPNNAEISKAAKADKQALSGEKLYDAEAELLRMMAIDPNRLPNIKNKMDAQAKTP